MQLYQFDEADHERIMRYPSVVSRAVKLSLLMPPQYYIFDIFSIKLEETTMEFLTLLFSALYLSLSLSLRLSHSLTHTIDQNIYKTRSKELKLCERT